MFKKAPTLWRIDSLVRHCDIGEKAGMDIGGSTYWFPARPEGNYRTFRQRLTLAWKVFSGKADAVFWLKGQ